MAEFRDQVARRLGGELSEDEFKPLRLMNGVYLQLHAYMLRIAIPYGTLSSEQMRMLAHVARRYDRGYGHFTTRQNIQFNWIKLADMPDVLADLARAELHAMQTSGNCRTKSKTRASGPKSCASIPRCIPSFRSCRASSRSRSPPPRMIAPRSRCTISDCGCIATARAKPASK